MANPAAGFSPIVMSPKTFCTAECEDSVPVLTYVNDYGADAALFHPQR
ncbi:hypothetical protein MJ581_13510 [Escherichia coli]|nr:hypothetical protein MJ581_13510 [Escherichia coli]